jgi:HAD superfamily hydrolase (TIGR01484 family)
MNYRVIATDYDGTLATEGVVDTATVAALQRYRDAGGHLILVTGRQLDDLLAAFPHSSLFSGIVVENGAVFYQPQRQEVRLLAEPFPPIFTETLAAQGVSPITQGQVIVATWEPHGKTVQRTIESLGLAATVILNKRAVMVLPQGINKATGLAVALAELGLTAEQAVGVGDAENDRSLLQACGWGVAVANALPELKAMAHYTTAAPRGAGVQELIDRVLSGKV